MWYADSPETKSPNTTEHNRTQPNTTEHNNRAIIYTVIKNRSVPVTSGHFRSQPVTFYVLYCIMGPVIKFLLNQRFLLPFWKRDTTGHEWTWIDTTGHKNGDILFHGKEKIPGCRKMSQNVAKCREMSSWCPGIDKIYCILQRKASVGELIPGAFFDCDWKRKSSKLICWQNFDQLKRTQAQVSAPKRTQAHLSAVKLWYNVFC